MPKTALLIIDLQNEVLHQDGKLRDDLAPIADQLLEATRKLVGWARRSSFPIIWVRAAYRPGYIDAARTSRESLSRTPGLLIDGSWGAEVVEGVGREPDDVVITKKRMSAFYQTDLDFVLRWFDVQRIVISGTSTNFSIESTVRDGHSRDYDLVVVREATGSRVGALHEPSMRVMATAFARVISLGELDELT